jgi:hypothetical protein
VGKDLRRTLQSLRCLEARREDLESRKTAIEAQLRELSRELPDVRARRTRPVQLYLRAYTRAYVHAYVLVCADNKLPHLWMPCSSHSGPRGSSGTLLFRSVSRRLSHTHTSVSIREKSSMPPCTTKTASWSCAQGEGNRFATRYREGLLFVCMCTCARCLLVNLGSFRR